MRKKEILLRVNNQKMCRFTKWNNLCIHEKAVQSFRPKRRNLFVAKVQSLTDVSTSLDMTSTAHIPIALHVFRSK